MVLEPRSISVVAPWRACLAGLAWLVCAAMSGCGQKGPLTLPAAAVPGATGAAAGPASPASPASPAAVAAPAARPASGPVR
ncbi:MAG: LPS translocon maturation chaperone LptM [Rubrivivax sp.]